MIEAFSVRFLVGKRGSEAIGYRLVIAIGGKLAISRQISTLCLISATPSDNRLLITDPTTGLLSRGSQVRILPGAPFLARFCEVAE